MNRIVSTLSLILMIGSGPVLAQQLPDLVAAQGYADMILVNGKIAAMDDRSSTPNSAGQFFQAMAIKGKTIMALGTDAEMRRLAGPKTRILELGGKTVLPGLIQTHYHIFGTAARVYGPQVGLVDRSVKLTVVTDTTPEATAKRIRDTILNAIRVQQIPKGKWITVDLQEGPQNRAATTRSWLYMGRLLPWMTAAALPTLPDSSSRPWP